jgi:hypothetical protein
MTRIRVDPKELRLAAQRLDDIASRIRALGREAREITENTPSHEGQFGPKARTMGLEAEARLLTQAERTSVLSEELIAKAAAFEEADQKSLEALHQLGESMNEWMDQATLTLSPFVMASAFPWQLIQRHLRLGALLGLGGSSIGPLPPPPIGPNPPEDIPLRVCYHLPRDDQLAILLKIAAEGKPEPTVWVPLVRPPFIDPEAWLRLPLDDQHSIIQWIQDWPAIHGITAGSTRYVRANLDELNKVWYYDEDGNLVETDLSYFGVEALNGEMWVEYDYEEVTRPLEWRENAEEQRAILREETNQSIAVRLLLGEIGADRIIQNANGMWESVAALQTIDHRITIMTDPAMGGNPDQLIDIDGNPPHWGSNWRNESEHTFSAVATAEGQYYGLYSSRGIDPQRFYLAPRSGGKPPLMTQDAFTHAVDLAAVAYELQSSGQIEDLTVGTLGELVGEPREVGAVCYAHRCGPPGTPEYNLSIYYCDGKPEPFSDKQGANPDIGPMALKAIINSNTSGGWIMQEILRIDYVPLE